MVELAEVKADLERILAAITPAINEKLANVATWIKEWQASHA